MFFPRCPNITLENKCESAYYGNLFPLYGVFRLSVKMDSLISELPKGVRIECRFVSVAD